MKKIIVLLILIISSQLVKSQTEEEEKKYLNSQVGILSQPELLAISREWRKLLEVNNGYPDIPYNSNIGSIDFEYIYDYPEFTKQQIFNRVKEWAAIYYGSLDAVLHYEDFNSGKIVLKGNFPFVISDKWTNFWGNPKESARTVRCFYTIIYTLKDNKLKVNYREIEYESTFDAIISSTVYIPSHTISYPITDLYPITKSVSSTWESRLNSLVETSSRIKQRQSVFNYFMGNLKEDMKF